MLNGKKLKIKKRMIFIVVSLVAVFLFLTIHLPSPISHLPSLVFASEPQPAVAISTRQGLDNVRNNRSGNFYLTSDIDLSGQDWAPLFTEEFPFLGTFDGRGFTIFNMKITRVVESSITVDGRELTQKVSGLFAASSGVIKNLSVVGADVVLDHEADVGIIAGINSGEILNCFASGKIVVKHGKDTQGLSIDDPDLGNPIFLTVAGGIASINHNLIKNCRAEVTIDIETYNRDIIAGGISGINEGSVEFEDLRPVGTSGTVLNSYVKNTSIKAHTQTGNIQIGGVSGANRIHYGYREGGRWIIFGGTVKDSYAVSTLAATSEARLRLWQRESLPPAEEEIHIFAGGIVGANQNEVINSVAVCIATVRNNQARREVVLAGPVVGEYLLTRIPIAGGFFRHEFLGDVTGFASNTGKFNVYNEQGFESDFTAVGTTLGGEIKPLNEIIDEIRKDWNQESWNFGFPNHNNGLPILAQFSGVTDGAVHATTIPLNFTFVKVLLNGEQFVGGDHVLEIGKFEVKIIFTELGEDIYQTINFTIEALDLDVIYHKFGTEIRVASIHPLARVFLNGREITETTIIRRGGTFLLEYELGGERRFIREVTFNNPNYITVIYLSIGGTVLVLAAVLFIIYRQKTLGSTKGNHPQRGQND
jgi:hypothetical protein